MDYDILVGTRISFSRQEDFRFANAHDTRRFVAARVAGSKSAAAANFHPLCGRSWGNFWYFVTTTPFLKWNDTRTTLTISIIVCKELGKRRSIDRTPAVWYNAKYIFLDLIAL